MKRLIGLLLVGMLSALPVLGSTAGPAAAGPLDELPTCEVHANSPTVTFNGLTATAFGSGGLICSASVSLAVVGSVINVVGGTSNGNGKHCQNCSSVAASAGPAISSQIGFTCAISKASGSAGGAVVVVPYAQQTYCTPPI
jgi:hypothetical protein